MKRKIILCPGHNRHLLLSALTAALGGRHIICGQNSDNMSFLGQDRAEKIYTLTDISIREIGTPSYYEDKVPSGMSPSYHHILSKQRKNRKGKL